MKSIYKSKSAKEEVIKLYDRQLAELGIQFEDIYIDTSFGKTHLVKTGNPLKKPLLLFHGGNATTAYNLKYCDFLLEDFCIYAVDTIGHPGKSAEVSLSPYNYDYGVWVENVIEALGFRSIACFGGSFGGGVLVKAMCVCPEKIERSVLLVPAGIKNAPAIKSMSMLFPMILYWITHNDKWFIRCILPMAVSEENISKDILVTARCSIDHAKIKKGMPGNARTEDMRHYENPVYVLAAEYDCLFPGAGVLKRVKKVWKQSKTYLLRGRGHINKLTEAEKDSILQFLK